MDDTAFASATRLAGEIRDRKIGCLELLDLFVARAERFNPALNAVIAWQVDAARAAPAPPTRRSPRARAGARCTASR